MSRQYQIIYAPLNADGFILETRGLRRQRAYMQPLPTQLIDVIAPWPMPAQTHVHTIRAAILSAVADTPHVGPISETLKWGQPSWLTEACKSGTTIRVAWTQAQADQIGLYLNCQTTLIATMREIYPDAFTYAGNRGLFSPLDAPLPTGPLDHVIRMAQSYHRSG